MWTGPISLGWMFSAHDHWCFLSWSFFLDMSPSVGERRTEATRGNGRRACASLAPKPRYDDQRTTGGNGSGGRVHLVENSPGKDDVVLADRATPAESIVRPDDFRRAIRGEPKRSRRGVDGERSTDGGPVWRWTASRRDGAFVVESPERLVALIPHALAATRIRSFEKAPVDIGPSGSRDRRSSSCVGGGGGSGDGGGSDRRRPSRGHRTGSDARQNNKHDVPINPMNTLAL